MTKTTNDQEWRDLCKLIAVEQDPQRLSQLVDNLIKAMDERRDRLEADAKKNSVSTSSAG